MKKIYPISCFNFLRTPTISRWISSERLKTKVLLFILFCTSQTFSIRAQDLKLELDTTIRREIRSYFDNQQEKIGHTQLKLAYRQMSFQNPTYYMYTKNKDIQHDWGFDLAMCNATYPFLFEVGFMFSKFTVNDLSIPYYPDYKDKGTRFYGFYASTSIFPLPDLGIVTDIAQPYLGIGYHLSSLYIKDGNAKDSSSEYILASYVLNGAKWKMGLLINLTKGLSLNGEYRQGFSTKDPTSFSEWTAGIVLKI